MRCLLRRQHGRVVGRGAQASRHASCVGVSHGAWCVVGRGAQAEREGRWWWEDAKAKECGLHSGNVKKEDGTTEARKAERDLWIDGRVATLSKEQVRGGGGERQGGQAAGAWPRSPRSRCALLRGGGGGRAGRGRGRTLAGGGALLPAPPGSAAHLPWDPPKQRMGAGSHALWFTRAKCVRRRARRRARRRRRRCGTLRRASGTRTLWPCSTRPGAPSARCARAPARSRLPPLRRRRAAACDARVGAAASRHAAARAPESASEARLRRVLPGSTSHGCACEPCSARAAPGRRWSRRGPTSPTSSRAPT